MNSLLIMNKYISFPYKQYIYIVDPITAIPATTFLMVFKGRKAHKGHIVCSTTIFNGGFRAVFVFQYFFFVNGIFFLP